EVAERIAYSMGPSQQEEGMATVPLPARASALLLQDLQNDLIKGTRPVVPLSGTELITNCQKLLTKARAVGMLVVYVGVARRPDLKDAPRPPLGTATGVAGPSILIEGTEGAEIVAELAPRPEDVVVTKHTTSPFHTTDLGVYLRRFGITTLILTGYSTTGGVEGALRDARDQGDRSKDAVQHQAVIAGHRRLRRCEQTGCWLFSHGTAPFPRSGVLRTRSTPFS